MLEAEVYTHSPEMEKGWFDSQNEQNSTVLIFLEFLKSPANLIKSLKVNKM
jgi:hypothetical protein